MKTTGTSRSRLRILAMVGGLICLVFLSLLVYRQVSGQSLGMRSLVENGWQAITSPVKNLLNSRSIKSASRGQYTNIIFLHHSTGNNLVQQGKVRVLLREQGYEMWDHGYNYQGLRDPDGTPLRYHYSVPNDNTNPDGLAAIFSQKVHRLPVNALSSLLQHEVIILKSCFDPASHIRDDEQLEQYKTYYLGMRQVMAEHPDRVFIILTTPPLNAAETNPEEAARVREYAEWLKSDEFVAGYSNIYVFDFFDLLAESDPNAADYNMLRSEYSDGSDSHPNQAANVFIAPLFTDFVVDSIETYRSQQAD